MSPSLYVGSTDSSEEKTPIIENGKIVLKDKLISVGFYKIFGEVLDNAIDVVYTSHSIEPNGGREEEALLELYRIAKKYVVLLEPCYEKASSAARKRMEKHNYITNLFDTVNKLKI